jgi:hypothetical protein
MDEKPTAAVVFSFISGIFLLVWGFWLTRLLLWRRQEQLMGLGTTSLSGRIGFTPFMVAVEGISGVIIISAAIMLARKPAEHKKYGATIVLFSLISLYGAPFGFSSVVGAVGGLLAIFWKPGTLV